MLDYPYLAESAFTDRTEEMKVGELDYWTKNENEKDNSGMTKWLGKMDGRMDRWDNRGGEDEEERYCVYQIKRDLW